MSQGRLRYHVLAQSALDPYTVSPNPDAQRFIREHVSLLGTYSPYFDSRLSWFGQALAYVDAYSIYTAVKDASGNYVPNPLAAQHPEWILRNAAGKPLFIPWGAKNSLGLLPQYAGDFSLPAFRDYQIGRMKAIMALGYRGIWIDDVNLAVRCTDGTTDAGGNPITVLPAKWSDANWAQRMADCMRAFRAGLPQTAKIVHNALWMPSITADVRLQASTCDLYYLERGYSGIGAGGAAQWGLAAFMRYIDGLHALGAAIALGDYEAVSMEYSVAGYLLTSAGCDMIGFADQPLASPWPRMLGLDLGPASGPRQQIGTLWARGFLRGSVYLNEPGAPQVTMPLPNPSYDVTGQKITSITLGAAQAKIVLFEAGS